MADVLDAQLIALADRLTAGIRLPSDRMAQAVGSPTEQVLRVMRNRAKIGATACEPGLLSECEVVGRIRATHLASIYGTDRI